MSKTRILIYALGIYNLQIRNALMNANTKNPQVEHCPCPNYDVIYRPDPYNLYVSKNI